MTDTVFQRLVLAYLLAVILAQATFAAFPGIDLAVSAAFANGVTGFPWAGGALYLLNAAIRETGEAMAYALVLWWLAGWIGGGLRWADLQAWAFAALGPVLAAGVIVNMVFKAHVGRARPAYVTQFGGEAQFTPAWQLTDQCSRNCSFTSGEVALAASLAIAAVVLLWSRLRGPGARVMAVALAVAYVAGVSLLRIGLGRHFLSDAVFSILVSTGVALTLYPLLAVAQARREFDPALPLAVGARWLAEARLRVRLAWGRMSWP